ncbi:MAG: hypothetical protein F6K24_42150 [Okeania sp. SIO2D1]|nr:hypothetical protein [Okeania sp. SIO2D1]
MIAATIAVPHANARPFPGGWSPYSSDITPEASKVFHKAMDDFYGVSYEPVAFATQIVAGINYSFFCNAKVVYPDAPNEAAIVDIYEAPGEMPYITEIRMIDQY